MKYVNVIDRGKDYYNRVTREVKYQCPYMFLAVSNCELYCNATNEMYKLDDDMCDKCIFKIGELK